MTVVKSLELNYRIICFISMQLMRIYPQRWKISLLINVAELS